MAVKPILKGDLRQRYEVIVRVSAHEWEARGWSNHKNEAEAIARHAGGDYDALEVKIVDRGLGNDSN